MRLAYLALPTAGLALVLAGTLLFGGLNRNLTYYLTPSEAVQRQDEFDGGRRFRLAGDVRAGSVRSEATRTRFTLDDGAAEIPVVYDGVPPQLFAPGLQVVVEGAWDGPEFRSDTMLIKHDEQYYPPTEPPR